MDKPKFTVRETRRSTSDDKEHWDRANGKDCPIVRYYTFVDTGEVCWVTSYGALDELPLEIQARLIAGMDEEAIYLYFEKHGLVEEYEDAIK
jgi:hypothetical protein